MIEFLQGLGILLGYFSICVCVLLLLRRFIRVPSEVSRKLFHIILVCSLFIWVYVFPTWWIASLVAVIFIPILFLLLSLGERLSCYSELLVQRKKGEIKHSAIVVFCMFAILNSVCWGWLDQKWIVIASISAWGFGDAAAALIGKRFGRHFLEGKMIEGRKSLEGTLGMFMVSLVAVSIVLLIKGNFELYFSIVTAVLTAAATTAVELFTRNGMDTITCPLAAAAVLLPLLYVWSVLL